MLDLQEMKDVTKCTEVYDPKIDLYDFYFQFVYDIWDMICQMKWG